MRYLFISRVGRLRRLEVPGDQDVRRVGGETFAELRERVWPVFRELSKYDGTVLAFTHGGPIRVAVASTLELPTTGQARLTGVDNALLRGCEAK